MTDHPYLQLVEDAELDKKLEQEDREDHLSRCLVGNHHYVTIVACSKCGDSIYIGGISDEEV